MKFVPKTEQEITEESLWPEGEYSFEIIDAVDHVSKEGKESIKLKMKVFSEDGNYIFVDDYLSAGLLRKLRHAADACGVLEQYNTGMLQADDFKGKSGRLKLFIQKSKDPQYSDKNSVKDYMKTASQNGTGGGGATAGAQETPTKFIDDNIPFITSHGMI